MNVFEYETPAYFTPGEYIARIIRVNGCQADAQPDAFGWRRVSLALAARKKEGKVEGIWSIPFEGPEDERSLRGVHMGREILKKLGAHFGMQPDPEKWAGQCVKVKVTERTYKKKDGTDGTQTDFAMASDQSKAEDLNAEAAAAKAAAAPAQVAEKPKPLRAAAPAATPPPKAPTGAPAQVAQDEESDDIPF
jgi:hypothetical protein